MFLLSREQSWNDGPRSLQTQGEEDFLGRRVDMETSFQSTTVTAGFRQHIGIWAAWVCLFLELAELVFAHCAAAFKPGKPAKTRYVPPRDLQLEDEGDTQVNSRQGRLQEGQLVPKWCFSESVRARAVRFLQSVGISASEKAPTSITCSLRLSQGQEWTQRDALKF